MYYNCKLKGLKMISTKGRYAIRLMIDIAKQGNTCYIPLKDIATRQQISKKYLEIIAKTLVEKNLLQAIKGKNGGYKLSRLPEDYTIGEILELMEGTLAPVTCLQKKTISCKRASFCETLPMWMEFNNIVRNYFFNKRLSDLL